MRGAPFAAPTPVDTAGIIPACAGSTGSFIAAFRSDWDHPRMCGEHPDHDSRPHHPTGSSPHVRGAPSGLRVDVCSDGIIPACAGSTQHFFPMAAGTRDHPRMCGEHQAFERSFLPFAGSSPHVRGARNARHDIRRESGIIPACAGSTLWIRAIVVACRDHPRMCGEHETLKSSPDVYAGSSPHVRGARVCAKALLIPPKIIPACAGSTSFSS